LRFNENNDRMNKCIFKQNNEIKCSGMIKLCQIDRVWGEWPCMQHAHAWWTWQEDGGAGGYASSLSSSFLFAETVKLTREKKIGVCVCFVRSNWQGCAKALDDSLICEQVVYCKRQLKQCFFFLSFVEFLRLGKGALVQSAECGWKVLEAFPKFCEGWSFPRGSCGVVYLTRRRAFEEKLKGACRQSKHLVGADFLQVEVVALSN
jgi:hypothetical protein